MEPCGDVVRNWEGIMTNDQRHTLEQRILAFGRAHEEMAYSATSGSETQEAMARAYAADAWLEVQEALDVVEARDDS